MSDAMQSGGLWLLVALVVLGVIMYMLRRRTTSAAPNDLPMSPDDPARALFDAAGDEPPTEDQIAQARLGGVRGNPKLGAAQMKGQAAEQTPKHIDEGHVA
jgi:hypothetical protein